MTLCQVPGARPLPFWRPGVARVGISDVQGQTTSGFMIEAPLDRGKWKEDEEKRAKGRTEEKGGRDREFRRETEPENS